MIITTQIWQWDFSAAYLNSSLPEDPPVYMFQPVGFAKQGEEDKVCLMHMHKPLYGMSQARHIWYKVLRDQFYHLGFKDLHADPCIQSQTDTNTGEYSIAFVHTDDVLSASSSKDKANNMVSGFRIWDLTNVKGKNFMVGLTVKYLTDNSVSISQAPFFIKAFQYFDLTSQLTPISTPLVRRFSLTQDKTRADKHVEFMKGKLFHGIVGCCWWGASCTKPDIFFA